MSKIRKVVITAFGDESKLAIVTADLPDPSPNQVQVAVDYSVVSGSDVNMRRGTYPFQKKAPLTPGYSILGAVLSNGKGSSKFKPGDLVACLSKYDGQADRINLPERFLVPVPLASIPKPPSLWSSTGSPPTRCCTVRLASKPAERSLSTAFPAA